MGMIGRLSLFLGPCGQRILLALMGMMVVQGAHANITVNTIVQSPQNTVAPGQSITFSIPISSDAIDGAVDYPVISISINGANITDQFFSADGCSLDGIYYCNNTGVDSTTPRTYKFTWVQPPQQSGTYVLTFGVDCTSASKCGSSLQQVSTIIAEPPVANDDSATTQAGTAVTIDVLGNDSDPAGLKISVDSVTTPAHGSVANNNGASVTYTPAAGYTGTDRFAYTIRNTNGDTASAVVDVTVVANTAPVAVDDSKSTTPGTAVTINLLANDTIPQGQQFSVGSISTPANGTVVNNNDGTATYTPNSGFTGTDTFDYTIADTDGQVVATATVSVTVAPAAKVGPQATTSLQALPNLTDNQRSVAGAVDQLCAASADTAVQNQCDIIATLSDADATLALQQITPDQLAAQGTTAVETSTTQLTNIKMRLMALRQGASGLSMNGFSLGIKGNSLPAGVLLAAMRNGGGGGASGDILGNGRLGVFVNGRINFGSLGTTSQQTGFDFDTNGITVGADYRIIDPLVVGGALGYAATSSTFSAGGGKMDASDFSVSTYGSYYMPRNAYLDWIATYGSNNYDTTRNIAYPGTSTQVKGSTGGNQFALAVNGGVDFNKRDILFSPYARLEYTSNNIDSYQEGGGSGLALGYNSQTIESLTTALAARLSKAMSMKWGILTPSAHVEWEHQYKDNGRLITAHFVAAPGVSFSVATDSPDRNYFNIGFGVAATLPEGKSAFIDYETVIGQDHVTNSTIDLGVRLAF